MAHPSDNLRIFYGEFRHSLDQKNRITIPSRWRSGDSDEFFITCNTKRSCLTVFPADVFKRLSEEAKAVAATPEEHRVFKSLFYSQAARDTLDKQGRLLIPDEVCKRIGLDSELILTGNEDRFEIWNPATWQARKEADQTAFATIAERMGL